MPAPRRLATLLAAAVLVPGLAVTGLVAAPAADAVTTCSASHAAVMTPIAPGDRAPGTVLACRRTSTLMDAFTDRSLRAWQLQYVTRSRTGRPATSTALVLVPSGWTGSTQPVVGYGSSTTGLASECANSEQLGDNGFVATGDPATVAPLLDRGWAVVVSDGRGYLRGRTAEYMVGTDNGRALLDAVRAASRLPGAPVSRTAKVGLYGYSEGGSTAAWAGQLAGRYAPELKIVGLAAGGTPADLLAVGRTIEGTFWSTFLFYAASGMAAANPALPFRTLLTAEGRAELRTVRGQCVGESLPSYAFTSLADYTVGHVGFEGLLDERGPDGVTWRTALERERLGVGVGRPGSGARYPVAFPSLQYWGADDDVIPPAVQRGMERRWCAAGLVVRRHVYADTDHVGGLVVSADDAPAWLAARFAGRPETGTC